MSRQPRLDLEVVIPVKWGPESRHEVGEMAGYLERLAGWVSRVTVVDGSEGAELDAHRSAWGRYASLITPHTSRWRRGPAPLNGKVVGALTGIESARADKVVLADDDVRHTEATLRALAAALDEADLVRPANVYTSWPWQARWDGARVLLNTAFGTDWPGTFALRRSVVLGAGGWDPHVLFENLELWRTVAAAGGRLSSRPDIVVPRNPPSVRQFLDQRVRQAYDDLAQPARLAVETLLLPAAVLTLRRRPGLALAGLAGVVAAAALARDGQSRRALPDGPRPGVPADVPLWSVAWLAERSVCVWAALAQRALGGVPYRGSRLAVAAHSRRWLAGQPGREAHPPPGGRTGAHFER